MVRSAHRSVEDYARRRGRIVLMLLLAFAAYTGVVCLAIGAHPLTGADWTRPSTTAVQALTWAIWAAALGLAISPFARRFRLSREERGVLNDELTQTIRARALRNGFLVLLLGTATEALAPLGLWKPPTWWPIAVVSAGIVAAAGSFAWLDLRADG